MDKTAVPECKTINWKLEGDNVVVNLDGRQQFLLNKSAKLVWEQINGVNTIQDIINELFKKYGDQNSVEYITEIVESSINLFLENGVVLLRTDDFDGWLQYE
ncbi:MAG: PqqD family protein [Firmicutes bacterium]|nr:PqqD family protein [Bacillota bacterium]